MSASGAIWRNWARTERVRPLRVERPTSVAAVQRAVEAAARAGLRIKAVGTGHSFSGIAVAPGVQLDLHYLGEPRSGGLIAVDEARGRVTLAAGTPLHRLPRLLAPYSLALANLGDVDRQTVAGATATGTHGTGERFGGLASQITALTLVTGTGALLHVSDTENAELLPAVRLGLGALGVIVDVTVQCVPAFLLHALERTEPLAEVLEDFARRSASADHFEFYWFAHTETAQTKTNTRLPLSAGRTPLRPLARWVDDELLANGAYALTCGFGAAIPALVPGFNRLAERLSSEREYTDASTRIFVHNRRVRFREMEYALPRAALPSAFREVQTLISRRGWRISFPIEVRTAAADDLWLSTAAGRDSVYIAVHRYYREDPTAFFAAVEEIMLAHGGRPHWGKMHGLGTDTLRGLYPRFDDFLRVRDRLDPERRFSNPYLERVLGR